MFHEFGHALHGLSSNVSYPSLSGTSVARDYVEFPSQILERWLATPEVLSRFALHYRTGQPMPKELAQKIERASTFRQGFDTVEYLASALMDMKLHLAGARPIDPDAFERETLAALGMPSEIVMRHRTPQFTHVFSGDGYAAGYYSYLWSDVLAADAWEAFTEAGGPWDTAVAKRLREQRLLGRQHHRPRGRLPRVPRPGPASTRSCASAASRTRSPNRSRLRVALAGPPGQWPSTIGEIISTEPDPGTRSLAIELLAVACLGLGLTRQLLSHVGTRTGASMLKGFRDFVSRGNVIDLAVGVIIGAAFGTIVDSLVKDLITPIVGLAFGQPDFSAIKLGPIAIGNFLNALVAFLIKAAGLYFLIVVPFSRFAAKMAAAAAGPGPQEVLLTQIRDLLQKK